MWQMAETVTTTQLGVYIDEVVFPCTRDELLRCAEDNDAPDSLLDVIEELPDRRYSDAYEVVGRIASYI